MQPLSASNARPAGRSGSTAKAVAPPSTVGRCRTPVPISRQVSKDGYCKELGGPTLTDRRNAADADPEAFFATISKAASSKTSLGMPLISPVRLSKAKPGGKAGSRMNSSTTPLKVGATATGLSNPNSSKPSPNAKPVGGDTSTANSRSQDVWPAAFRAVTVQVDGSVVPTAAPVTAPVAGSSSSPAGKGGLTSNSEGAPLTVGRKSTALPAKSLSGSSGYVRAEGGPKTTSKLNEVCTSPPEFAAVTS
mmetsp:Transcript_36664/g.105537  ORF Transcript_36664/g.105537 Transcript_36664/m.105537 type:complete len:249 (+) Transcript_36664:1627-2373(+)